MFNAILVSGLYRRMYFHHAHRIGMLPVFFDFNPRRLKQDRFFKMGLLYLKANILRFFKGELRNNEIPYPFEHYKKV